MSTSSHQPPARARLTARGSVPLEDTGAVFARVPRPLWEWLRHHAIHKRRPIAGIIRTLLEDYQRKELRREEANL